MQCNEKRQTAEKKANREIAKGPTIPFLIRNTQTECHTYSLHMAKQLPTHTYEYAYNRDYKVEC